MIPVKEARDIILGQVPILGTEKVDLFSALGRILAEDIVAPYDVPPHHNSAMDGYAIIADDTHGATKNNPVKIRIIGEIQAGGSVAGKKVSNGTAIRIMTGAPMPEGADSVIKFEDTEEDSGYVKIFHETVKYNNYRSAGENIKKGDKVLRKGTRLNTANIGILSSLNYNSVKVYKQPTVSIISTGDELAGIGEEIQSGHIRDVNGYTLYSEVKKYNALPEYLGIAKDTYKDIKEMFLKALKYDVVISTGGISMGNYDFVKKIYHDLDIEIQFEWINIKPGKPFTFGIKDNKQVFGLPGTPVSTLTTFIQFVRPALLRLMGANRINKPTVNAFLEHDINNKHPGKVLLLRGYFTNKNNELYVSTTGNQKPSVFRSMSDANCLIIIPENISEIKAGEKVKIQLIEHDEI